MTVTRERPKHPAQFTPAIIDKFDELLDLPPGSLLLDPFAGLGDRATEWCERRGWQFVGVELEEWAGSVQGDATALPIRSCSIDAAATSPCLAPHERVLTYDLRWIPSGDVKVGERLLAFEEQPSGRVSTGQRSLRRRYQVATVTHSAPAMKDCVRVHLSTGQTVECTSDHPWLADPYASGGSSRGRRRRWVRADALLDQPYVLRQLDTWTPETSYDAGWLAGMFDGEGHVSFGAKSATSLTMTQVAGPISDRFIELMKARGFPINSYLKQARGNCYQHWMCGGIAEILRALGTLRPGRLIQNYMRHDAVELFSIQPTRIRVEAVEHVGMREIQGITTTSGTYIGEGYLMHNTYGNGLADEALNWANPKGRRTYDLYLGKPARESSTTRCGLRGHGARGYERYLELHDWAYRELFRVLKPGAPFLLNASDVVADARLHPVTGDNVGLALGAGFAIEGWHHVPTPRYRNGRNAEARADHEDVVVLRKPAESGRLL